MSKSIFSLLSYVISSNSRLYMAPGAAETAPTIKRVLPKKKIELIFSSARIFATFLNDFTNMRSSTPFKGAIYYENSTTT